MRLAASLSASTLVISSTPARVADSKRLGVTMVARGRILERSASSTARAEANSWPLQMSTGSSTTVGNRYSSRAASTTSMVGAVPSMPILTAAIAVCTPAQASIWSWMTSGSTGTKRWSKPALGSMDTMQVRAVQPKTPSWWKVLRSVWAPAPPEASEPAMARTTGGTGRSGVDVMTPRVPPMGLCGQGASTT